MCDVHMCMGSCFYPMTSKKHQGTHAEITHLGTRLICINYFLVMGWKVFLQFYMCQKFSSTARVNTSFCGFSNTPLKQLQINMVGSASCNLPCQLFDRIQHMRVARRFCCCCSAYGRELSTLSSYFALVLCHWNIRIAREMSECEYAGRWHYLWWMVSIYTSRRELSCSTWMD